MVEEDILVMEDTDKKMIRPIPQSDLDFNLMTTNTEWGSHFIPNSLKDKLSKHYVVSKDGKKYLKKEGMWELLGFYTRDLRLANLSHVIGEVTYCQYFLDLANDFLRADFTEPFLICLSRVATVLELSQSKGGFLRRRMNTLTQENFRQEIEPKKKNFFGMNKGGER